MATFIILLFASINSYSQVLEMIWSPLIEYDRGTYIWSFVAQNDDCIYLERKKTDNSRKIENLKIYAFQKNVNIKAAELPLMGFKENKATKKTYKKLGYWKTVSVKDKVFVLWRKGIKDSVAVYFETFDSRLNRLSQLKELAVTSNKTGSEKVTFQNLFYNSNRQKFLIASELAGNIGDKVRFELKVFSEEFKELKSFETELPVRIENKRQTIRLWSMVFGDDYALHFECEPTLAEDQIKVRSEAASNEARPLILGMGSIHLETESLICKTIAFEGVSAWTYEKEITSKGIRLFGFQADTQNDVFEKHKKILGFFDIQMNPSYEILDIKVVRFTPVDIGVLFENQPYEEAEMIECKVSNPDFLSSEYEVEETYRQENGDIYFFCSRNHVRQGGTDVNYTTTTRAGTTSFTETNYVTTTFYNIKTDVVVFKVSNQGKLVWISKLPRRMTYSGDLYHHVQMTPQMMFSNRDVHVFDQGEQLLILTADEYDINKEGKAVPKKKKAIKETQPIRVFSINKQDGSFSTSEINTTKDDGTKKEIEVVNGKKTADGLYFHSYEGNSLSKGYVGSIYIEK